MLSATCDQSELRSMVQTVGRAARRRGWPDVCKNIHIEATEGQLRLVATDMEYLAIHGSVPAQVTREGSIAIDAHILADVTRALVNGDVTLEEQPDHSLAISGGGSSYALKALPGEEFPAPPNVGDGVSFILPQGILYEAIEQTIFATDRDGPTWTLTGALFDVGPDGLTVVATDAYRLALRCVRTETGMAQSKQAIVPARALTELTRLLERDSPEPVYVTMSNRMAQFDMGSVRISSNLVEGTFPNYEKFITTDHTKAITCRAKELAAALRRVLVVARDDAYRVLLRGSGDELWLRSQATDVGNAEEHISARIDGGDAEIAFNIRFLLDVLEVCPEERVVISLTVPLNPATITPEGRDDYLYVVMPMNVV